MTRRAAFGLARALRRFRRREDGVATLEFVLMVPAFLMIFMASFESGLLMTRYIMLERSLDMVVRDLRLGNFAFSEDATAQAKHDAVKTAICSKTVMFPECESIMLLEMRAVSQVTWEPLNTAADCVNRADDFTAVDQFTEGTDNEMMLVRACAIFDPIFPMTGVGLRLRTEADGGYKLVASSAFVNEPSI
jgi:Flp pilus assembly protein TadG